MDLYVYYKLPGEHASNLQQRVAAMQARLKRGYGIASGLKRRPGEKDGHQTWMEVYLGVPEGFATVVEQAAADAGLAELIDGARHPEQFLDVTMDATSCA